MSLLYFLFGLISIGLAIGVPVAAFIAFFRTDTLQAETRRMSLELQGLRLQLDELRASAPRPLAPLADAAVPTPAPIAAAVEPLPAAGEPVFAPPEAPPAPTQELALEPVIWTAPSAPAAPVVPVAQASFEERIATRWFVWVAGVAFALGSLFLVRQVWDQAWFGPWARIGAGTLLSFALLGAAEWMMRGGSRAFPPLAAPVTAAAGLVALFGVSYAGFAVYELYAGTTAFALLAAITAAGAALGLRFGAPISILSMAGAYGVPLMVGGQGAHPLVLFTFLSGVSALGLALVALRGWTSAAVTTVIGAVGWTFVWLTLAAHGEPPWPAALFIAAHAAAGALLARPHGPLPLSLNILRGDVRRAPAGLIAGAAFVDLTAPGFAFLTAAGGYPGWGLIATLAAAAFSLAVARWRSVFSVAPAYAALACLALLAGWPRGTMGWAAEAQLFLAFALAVSALFFAGGQWAATRMRLPALAHYVAAFTPLGAYALAWQGGPVLTPLIWALAAFAGALVMVAALEALGRPKPRPLAQSVYGIAAALFVAAGVTLALDGADAALGFGAAALLGALFYARWGFTLLGLAAALLGARALIGLAFNIGEPAFGGAMAVWPAFLLTHGGTLALLAGAGFVARRAEGARGFVTIAFEALILAVAMLTLTLGLRLALRGSITALSFDLLEAASYVTLWLTTALALRLSGLTTRSIALRIGEGLIAAAAVFLFVSACLLHFNPVWGAGAEPVFGPAIFNPLLLAYGAPGVLAAAYAAALARAGDMGRGRVLEVMAALALPLWATFETRRAFTGGDLARTGVSAPEQWAYSVVWLLCGAVLLGVGFARGRRDVRFAALALIALTIAKVFLLDMADLTGVWRALSFLALGAVLLALVFAYQRFILPAEKAAAARAAAVNETSVLSDLVESAKSVATRSRGSS